ncbi:MAG: ExbD/TolR family protein [Phycisphaerales bacterium]
MTNEQFQPDQGQRQGQREDVIQHRSLRQRRGRGNVMGSLNLTSMIDVTFLLLVYFMAVTEFRVGEEVYPLDLPPQLQSDQQRDPFDLDDEPLRVMISSTGSGIADYRISVEGPYREQPESFEALFEFLSQRQINEQNVASGALFLPDHPIIIQPGRTAIWDHAVGAFSAAARARYTNIRMARPQ